MDLVDLDILHRVVEEACRMGASYADVRLEEVEGVNVTVRKGSVEAAAVSRRMGAGVRVLVEGSWGFSSTEAVDEASLMEAVRNAFKMARSSSTARRRRARLAEVKACRDRVRARVREDPADVDPGEKVRLVLELDKLACSYGDVIRDVSIRYFDGRDR
ncbi:MAG: hypothetical protein DRJ57_02440, partial [Thermoprotei archaeon]